MKLPMWIALTPAEAFDLLTLAALADDRTPGEQASLDRLAAGLSSLAESESTPPHLVPTVSNRGLKRMPKIHPAPLQTVRVSESVTKGPGIYLEVYVEVDGASVTLPLEDAKQLRDQLDWLIRSAGA